MIIDKRSENSVYITMGDWVYYFDDGIEGEQVLTRWRVDQQDGSYYRSPDKWTLVDPPIKPATKEEIQNLFVKLKDRDKPRETYTDNYTMDCPACNATAEGEGVFFSDSGELIKNNFVQCTKCDWNQAS